MKQGRRLFEENKSNDVLSHDSKDEDPISEGYLSAYDDASY